MIDKLLIANRGEIAVRIIRTAKRLGITTVLAVSEADRHAPAAALADEVAPIGPAPAADSYLRGDRIIAAARRTGAAAIHPGYGFLAENADFAEAVVAAGLTFVGPSAAAMRALGNKAAAKALAIQHGVPVVPGYQGTAQDAARLVAEARQLGFPVLLKAVDGGGGRGMRRVDRAEDLADQLDSARREAQAAFGSDRMLVEKMIERPRHIEVQVFGDRHGNLVHLYERDCSLQRRNQKVVEEAPAPGMTSALRERMTAAAVGLAKAVGYENAGTVEFLVPGGAQRGGKLAANQSFFFIEMNTRLQVEHPVSEAITGLDLVEWQLRVASGEALPLGQDAIAISGHAVELRLNAEDPANGFAPSTGRVVAMDMVSSTAAGGIRCDTGIERGSVVTPYYDSLIAKVIAHGATRAEAMTKVAGALRDVVVAGPRTNVAFLAALLADDDVAAGQLDTGLIGRKLATLTGQGVSPSAVAHGAFGLLQARARIARMGDAQRDAGPGWSPWDANDGFQLGEERRLLVPVIVDGVPRSVEASWGERGLQITYQGAVADQTTESAFAGHVFCEHDSVYVVHDLVQTLVSWPKYNNVSLDDVSAGATGDTVLAPITGRVVAVTAAEGLTVQRGAQIAVVEAMKMEHVVVAARAGVIARIAVSVGDQVVQGALIAAFVPARDGGEA